MLNFIVSCARISSYDVIELCAIIDGSNLLCIPLAHPLMLNASKNLEPSVNWYCSASSQGRPIPSSYEQTDVGSSGCQPSVHRLTCLAVHT